MGKVITVELTPESINKALAELQKHKEWRERKVKELLLELGRIGAEATGYGSMVSVEETEYGCRIVARGEGIAFIEFGAGDAAVGYPKQIDGVDIRPGSWSESELGSGEYAAKGYWYFGGQKYTEIPQRRGMIKAEEAILQNFKAAAERIFANG